MVFLVSVDWELLFQTTQVLHLINGENKAQVEAGKACTGPAVNQCQDQAWARCPPPSSRILWFCGGHCLFEEIGGDELTDTHTGPHPNSEAHTW